MDVIGIDRIKEMSRGIDIIPLIEAGFVAYSEDRAVIPPVGELLFHDPPGDVHIKYGYLKNDAYYVIKIASGFYHNPSLNLPSSNGLMLLFGQKTGELLGILLDEGYLTDVRTAAAGAIAAKHLAPQKIHRITATASTSPLLSAGQIRKGTHITAVGADTPEKQELDPAILGKADLVVADSISQCVERGEIAHAIRDGEIEMQDIIELGRIIGGKTAGRKSDGQITVADLTGVAVQDIQIAKAVYEAIRG